MGVTVCVFSVNHQGHAGLCKLITMGMLVCVFSVNHYRHAGLCFFS